MIGVAPFWFHLTFSLPMASQLTLQDWALVFVAFTFGYAQGVLLQFHFSFMGISENEQNIYMFVSIYAVAWSV